MLKLKDISFSYQNNVEIFDKLNIEFEENKTYAIQGVSGSGKTTLLNIIAGLDDSYKGEIIYQDQVIDKNKLQDYRKNRVSIIFQDNNLLNYLNIKDNIKQGCLIKNKAFDEALFNEYLTQFKLDNLNLNSYPSILSGGQQQRVAIIRSLLSKTDIILADEPTASVDEVTAMKIIEELKELSHNENKLVIIVTHQKDIANKCDYVYHLQDYNLVLD
ncbi:MAG: ATP-binding cassette domain-containing protein [Bacilli bacterium]|jgi:putative ABC transport system ATP-binding protein|nr:ATP-binding cassette domain-containing protein [Bacilli bacterium]